MGFSVKKKQNSLKIIETLKILVVMYNTMQYNGLSKSFQIHLFIHRQSLHLAAFIKFDYQLNQGVKNV